MGIDKEQENRLISGETPVDDPTWGEVSAFLEAVDAAYADTSAAQYEAAIVAAVSHEARSIRNAPQTNRRTSMKDLFTIKTHRLLIGSVIAAVVALTAGVGVAAATGTGPLANLLPAAPETTAASFEPTPVISPTEEPTASSSADDDADDQAEGESDDDSTSTPSATPTSHRSDDEADDDEGDDDSDHSSAGSSHDSDSDEAEDEADDEAEDEAEDESDDSSEHQKAESSHDDSVDDSSDDSSDDDSED